MTHWPTDGGEMAGRIRAFDWATTPLGPIGSWPQSLRVATRLLLNTRHPMFIWWGPDLIQLYNDAYRDTMGPEKHPSALGGRGRDTWAEIWGVIGPQIAQVMGGGPSTWHEDQLVPVTRHGSREQVWWTYGFSPIDDEAAPDGVGGVLVICRDVTQEHLARAAAVESEARFHALFAASPVPFMVLAPNPPDFTITAANEAYFAATLTTPDSLIGRRLFDVFTDDPSRPGMLGSEALALSLGRVLASGRTDKMERVRYDLVVPGGFEPHWWEATNAPMLDAAGRIGAIIHQVNRVTDLHLAEMAEQEHRSRQAFLLELSDAFRPLTDPVALQTAAMRLLAERLDVSRAGCFEIEEDDDAFHMAGRFERDVLAMPERMRLSDFSPAPGDAYRSGRTLTVCDTGVRGEFVDDPGPYAAMGVGAWAAVPLTRGGRPAAWIGVHSRTPREWSAADLKLLDDVAERTWGEVEKARAEAAMKESETRFRTLAETAPALIWRNDARGENLFVNRRLTDYTGKTVTEIEGEAWQALVHPDDAETYVSGYMAAVEGRRAWQNRHRIRRHDGAWRWFENYAQPLFDERERYAGHVGVSVDVTDMVMTEHALRESEEQQRMTLQLVPAMLWTADPAGRLIAADQSWRSRTGQRDAEIHDFGWLDAIHPDDRAATRAAFAHAFATGEPIERQQRIRQGGDGYRWHLVRHVPVRDGSGTVTRWFGAAIDVHDLHELQDRQQVLVAELQHRTRNLIAVVRGIASDTMRETGPTETFRAAFADRLSALSRVQGLLSRSEDEPITIASLLRLELDAVGAGGGEDRVTVGGPEVFLRPSGVQTLALALHELATNARKHGALSHAGGHLAVTWRKRSEAGERRLVIEWTETGLEQAPERPMSGKVNRGYGRELIEHALPHALGARTTYGLTASGVRCTIDLAVRPGKGKP